MNSWTEQLKSLQTKLIAMSPIDVDANVTNAVRLFNQAHNEILSNGATKIHLSPLWADMSYVVPPINPKIVPYLCLRKIAENVNVPTTWLFLLPYKLSIGNSHGNISFLNENILYVDKNGYATDECLMAFYDGKEMGLLNEDEPFIFSNSPTTNQFLDEAKKALTEMAEKSGLTFDGILETLSPTHIDAPFPHENNHNFLDGEE